MNLKCWFVVSIHLGAVIIAIDSVDSPYTRFLDEVMMEELLPKNYSKDVPPNYAIGKKSPYTLFSQPIMIRSLNVREMEFEVDIRIHLSWKDDRFALHHNGFFTLSPEVAKKIWKPMIELSKCKSCTQEYFLDPTKDKFVLKAEDKTVSVNKRFVHKIICVYHFTRFPFDVQKCTAGFLLPKEFDSHVDSTDDEVKNYSKMAIKNIVIPPEYNLVKIELQTHSNFDYTYHFKRIYTSYILLTYVPCALVVILSWITFYLSFDLAPARLALGLTSTLTLCTILITAQKDLPAVGEIKALDIYVITSLSLVFASICEFVIAFSLNRREQQKETTEKESPQIFETRTSDETSETKFVIDPKSNPGVGLTSKTLDNACKIVFPAFFILFNTVYCIYFIN